MKDKTGKEIQNGDLLRIKFKMYGDTEHYDGIYKVILNEWEGATLRLVELFEPEETYHTSLVWTRGDLTFDYKNAKTKPNYGEYLAIDDKYEDINRGNTIHLRSYSNDIKKVSNFDNEIKAFQDKNSVKRYSSALDMDWSENLNIRK